MKSTKRISQGLAQTDYEKMQQYPQVAQLLQTSGSAPKIKYKSQEEYFDQVNQLKQENSELKEKNAFLTGRVRSLEKQLHSEDRLLNLNVTVPTTKTAYFDSYSHQATTGNSPRLAASPKFNESVNNSSSNANVQTVHLVAYKKQLIALKAELATVQQRCATLENDVKRSNLDQWRTEKETYYQEVQRLQAVMKLRQDGEKERELKRPIYKEEAAQTDTFSVNAYSDLALKQMLSHREEPTVMKVTQCKTEMQPKSPSTPKSGERNSQQVSRLKALLCTIMTQAQKIRGLEHENRMLRVRIEVEENEARKSIQDFVSNRLEHMQAELEGRSADIEFVSLKESTSDSDAVFEADRLKGQRLGQDWVLKELLARGDRIQELESEIRELRMQLSQQQHNTKSRKLSESLDDESGLETTGRTRLSLTDQPEKPFEDSAPHSIDADESAGRSGNLDRDDLEEPGEVEEEIEPAELSDTDLHLPTQLVILPQTDTAQLQPESPRSLDDDSVNELADILRGYVACKNVQQRGVPQRRQSQADLDPEEVDMLLSQFLAHQSNKQRQAELESRANDNDAYDQVRSALLAHSARKQKVDAARDAAAPSSALDDDELQTLMANLAAHQTRQRQLQQLEFLNGARTKQYSKA